MKNTKTQTALHHVNRQIVEMEKLLLHLNEGEGAWTPEEEERANQIYWDMEHLKSKRDAMSY